MLQFDPFLSDLSQNPHRVAQLLEAFSIGVVVHQSDGRVLFMNRMGRVLLNLSAENRPDLDDLDRVYPFQRIGTQQPYPPTESPITLALAGQASTAEDIELADVSPVRYLKVSASPLFSPVTDRVQYVIVVLEDITRQVLAERVLAKYNQHLMQQVRERTEALQREVIERHKTELALRQSPKRFQSLANMLPGSIFSLVRRANGTEVFEYVSVGMEQIYEVSMCTLLENAREVLLGQTHPEDRMAYLNAFEHSARTLELLHHEWRIITPSRQVKWLQVSSQPERRENGDICWHGVITDISDRKAAEEALRRANTELKQLATLDGLTQIANRRRFDEHLSDLWCCLSRPGESLSLLLLDVDSFKLYNDYYGHQRGDTCLMELAQLLQRCVHRANDLVARYGGEEFGILLAHTDLEGAAWMADQICTLIRTAAIPHEGQAACNIVTASIGVASLVPSPDLTPETLVQQADAALYEAKRQGRDRFVLYQPGMTARFNRG